MPGDRPPHYLQWLSLCCSSLLHFNKQCSFLSVQKSSMVLKLLRSSRRVSALSMFWESSISNIVDWEQLVLIESKSVSQEHLINAVSFSLYNEHSCKARAVLWYASTPGESRHSYIRPVLGSLHLFEWQSSSLSRDRKIRNKWKSIKLLE